MATTALSQRSARRADDAEVELTHPVSVNIKPILDSVAGKLTDEEIDQWFVDLETANEENGLAPGDDLRRGVDNQSDGESRWRDGGRARIQTRQFALGNWEESNGRRSIRAQREYPSCRMDLAYVRMHCGCRRNRWPGLPPVSEKIEPSPCVLRSWLRSFPSTDTLPPLQRKMERYMVNGAQLGWLIDPYRRQVHVYRPGALMWKMLEDPEDGERRSGDARVRVRGQTTYIRVYTQMPPRA